jgi:2-(1,2-epoxy-1,2-dihydrophenyl)acetyl-CoA isomerase
VGYSDILYEKRDRVGVITLNRPEKLNAWTTHMAGEIVDAVADANEDESVGCVLFRGAGPRAFCAGADIIEQFKRRADAQDAGTLEELEGEAQVGPDFPALIKLLHFGKASVAALHGYAMGIGVTLPMHCDMRIAAESLKLNTQFLNVGLTPEFGSTYLLPRMIGLAKTLELVLLPRTYSAQEALEIGLVNRVVPEDRLMDETMEIAKAIAKRPTFAVRKAKETIYQNFDRHWLEALQVEMAVFAECMGTAEHREGIRAFMEKREPDFTRKE